MLQDLLTKERTMKRLCRQDLKKAQDELTSLCEKKKKDDEHCVVAVTKIEEFKGKYRDAQSKITNLEANLETSN